MSQLFSAYRLSWPKNFVTYLGVNIPITTLTIIDSSEIFVSRTREVQTLLNIWSTRGLTLLEKTAVLKSLVIPKSGYKATYLPVTLPEIFIKQLN